MSICQKQLYNQLLDMDIVPKNINIILFLRKLCSGISLLEMLKQVRGYTNIKDRLLALKTKLEETQYTQEVHKIEHLKENLKIYFLAIFLKFSDIHEFAENLQFLRHIFDRHASYLGFSWTVFLTKNLSTIADRINHEDIPFFVEFLKTRHQVFQFSNSEVNDVFLQLLNTRFLHSKPPRRSRDESPSRSRDETPSRSRDESRRSRDESVGRTRDETHRSRDESPRRRRDETHKSRDESPRRRRDETHTSIDESHRSRDESLGTRDMHGVHHLQDELQQVDRHQVDRQQVEWQQLEWQQDSRQQDSRQQVIKMVTHVEALQAELDELHGNRRVWISHAESLAAENEFLKSCIRTAEAEINVEKTKVVNLQTFKDMVIGFFNYQILATGQN